MDAQQDFPNTAIPLETDEGTYHHFKTDVFKRLMWFSSGREHGGRVVMLSVDKVNEIIALNKKGKRVMKMVDETPMMEAPKDAGYSNVVAEESLTRFDDSKPKPKNTNKRRKKRRPSNRNRSDGRNQNKKNES